MGDSSFTDRKVLLAINWYGEYFACYITSGIFGDSCEFF